MITPRLVGPRGILCLSGLVASSILLMGAHAASEPQVAEPPAWLQIRMKETPCSVQSTSSPVLDEVRAVLSAALESGDDRESLEARLWNGLDRAFGADMTQTAAPVEYVWVMINGQWVRKCLVSPAFEIDFGAQGTVLVTCRASMPTP